jgi:hypothetical protein
MNQISEYLTELTKYFADNASSEMSYRTALQNYLATIFPAPEYIIQHDPKAISGNKPDYIIRRGEVPLLYIEVKDPNKPGSDLDKIEKSEQATRYFGYTNFILSDYAEFRFYRNGERYTEPIKLATLNRTFKTIDQHPEAGDRLAATMREFIASQKEPIKSGKHLARIMGGKAQRIRDNVVAFLDSESTDKDELVRMMQFIKENLIVNSTKEDFADMYAQTLVYGLFAARYNDSTPEGFTRLEAQTLVPKSNPFLKHFFGHIAGVSFPRRLEIIVDELCAVFSHADVKALMEDYFKATNLFGEESESPDPVIHFYEDFLHEYDPKKKMEMGVFYTPLPVVRFIVRGIDDLLKREFGITKGLADNSKIPVEKKGIGKDGKQVTDTVEVHRVQVLDIATGTGTFLNEVIAHIYEDSKHLHGRWEAYVEDHLLPRLHGFELMMASYTIAHLKLGMTLSKEGIIDFKSRLGVYLTNTLDTPHDIEFQSSLFGVVESIAEESKLASQVKKEHPIMVVIGNPPYSGISQNKHYTDNEVYKVEMGGKERLKEKKNWLDDDYVKFIRFAESMIEKNGEGIIGMITAHGYIDNPTFRGMRWHLRQTFDAIYVLDLHGNSNKKESAPDGSEDKNVFDIKTGVSIIFGVKKRHEGGETKPLATIYQADLYGRRAQKFETLSKGSMETIAWNQLPSSCEVWKIEGKGKVEYKKGFSVAELFPKNTTGVVTMGDSFIVDESRDVLYQRVEEFLENAISEKELQAKYKLGKNYAKWVIDNKEHLRSEASKIVPLSYRPFDIRHTYFDNRLVWRTRTDVMRHLVNENNLSLVAMRQATDDTVYNQIIVSKNIVDNRFLFSGKGITVQMPLYLYENGQKIPNLDGEIVQAIESIVGTTTPEDILDYVYTVLHSPAYRQKYSEFLKSDFPRVPYPSDKETFWQLVPLGTKLRHLHLLTTSAVERPITSFPIVGSNEVTKPVWQGGKVYINDTQYWDGVPQAVWNFYIGGYQSAQKYLKDRKGRTLTTPEFENYEKMIVSLDETIKVMAEVDRLWKA